MRKPELPQSVGRQELENLAAESERLRQRMAQLYIDVAPLDRRVGERRRKVHRKAK